jgi:O-antigen/teichoic acid export membrane protein
MAAGLVTTVIVARVLGAEGRGLFSVATVVSALGLQATNLGLHASNTYAAARAPALVPALLGNSIVAAVVLGGAAAAGAAALFLVWPSLAPVHGTLLFLALAAIPLGLLYLLLQGLLLGVAAIGSYNRIEIATRLLGLILVVGVILLGRVNVVALFAPAVAATAGGGVLAYRRLMSRTSGSLTISRDVFRENLRYGLKAYLSAFFSFLVLRGDLFIVKHLTGAVSAGYYSITVTLAEIIMAVPVVIGALLFPRLARAEAGGRWPLARRALRVVALAMTVVTVVAFAAAAPVVQLLFGPEFLPAVPALRWLLPGVFLLSLNTILMNFFAAEGMPRFTVLSPGIAAAANIALNLWAIPAFGIVGAAAASSLTYAGMLGASLIYVRRTV